MKIGIIIHLIPILTLVVVVSIGGGRWLAERLPLWSHMFDVKPFNCRPCLTFHLVWLPIALYAIAIECLGVAMIGIVVALAVFAIIKYIDNKNVVK